MKTQRFFFIVFLVGIISLSHSQTVTIGTQIWMSKNLDVTTFRNGDTIQEAKTTEEWNKAFWNHEPAWCFFNNDPKNGEKSGKLYNWYAVSDARSLAPEGWHIPSENEYKILRNCIDKNGNAGKKMKSICGWSDNGNGTNESGFSAIPVGTRSSQGNSWFSIGTRSGWWCSNEINPNEAWCFELSSYSDDMNQTYLNKGFGNTVRCLSDQPSPNFIQNNLNSTETNFNQISDSINQTINIGNQRWMSKNLDVGSFRNGNRIPEAKSKKEWEKARKKQRPVWCYYNFDPKNGEKFGKLYNWYAVNNPHGLAPEGFHIPSNEEWSTLTNYLGDGDVAGVKMKSTHDWIDPNTCFNGCGTNSSGFSGLPGGGCSNNGYFANLAEHGYWWSNSENNSVSAWAFRLNCLVGLDNRNYIDKAAGLSVRCIKD
jgi:uncharacterized protein (TIGR02145 family)